jgi:c-di-GMP-binding flagellar brake protein YcgR
MVAPRRKHQVPVKIWFEPEKNTGKLKNSTENLFMSGETADISATGIGFLVSSIRIKENYLVGQNRVLNAELDLSGAKVRMKIIGHRYEQVGIHISTSLYLIGASICQMEEADREVYQHFIQHGDARKKGSLALGIDKT